MTRDRRIRVTIGDQVLTGTLEYELAPRTCAAFVKLLPLRGELLQARWSGEAAWVPLDGLDLGVGAENQMHRPLPGHVLFYPAGMSSTEILVPYGVTAFAAKCGPLSGNHFLTLENDGGRLAEIGRRVWRDGVQDIEFAVMAEVP